MDFAFGVLTAGDASIETKLTKDGQYDNAVHTVSEEAHIPATPRAFIKRLHSIDHTSAIIQFNSSLDPEFSLPFRQRSLCAIL